MGKGKRTKTARALTGNATWRQAGRISSFIKATEDIPTTGDWKTMAKEGMLSKSAASTIIGVIVDIEAEYTAKGNAPHDECQYLESLMAPYDDGYSFDASRFRTYMKAKASQTPASPAVPEPVEELPEAPEDIPGDDDEDEEKDEVADLLGKLTEALKAKEEVQVPGGIRNIKIGGDYIKPPEFDELYAFISGGLNTLLSGPAGCGKSRLVEEVAKAMDTEFFTISFSGGMRYAQTFGGTQIKEDGTTEWVPSQLLQAVQVPGVVFLDEIFSAEADIALGLNSLLEPNSRSIMTPIGKIDVHEQCHFVGAANTVGRNVSRQHNGASRCDDSLLDRWITVRMDYSDEVECALVERALDRPDDRAFFFDSLKHLRDGVHSNNIGFDPSTRRLINCLRAFSCGVEKERAWEVAFTSGLSKAELGKIGGI